MKLPTAFVRSLKAVEYIDWDTAVPSGPRTLSHQEATVEFRLREVSSESDESARTPGGCAVVRRRVRFNYLQPDCGGMGACGVFLSGNRRVSGHSGAVS